MGVVLCERFVIDRRRLMWVLGNKRVERRICSSHVDRTRSRTINAQQQGLYKTYL